MLSDNAADPKFTDNVSLDKRSSASTIWDGSFQRKRGKSGLVSSNLSNKQPLTCGFLALCSTRTVKLEPVSVNEGEHLKKVNLEEDLAQIVKSHGLFSDGLPSAIAKYLKQLLEAKHIC